MPEMLLKLKPLSMNLCVILVDIPLNITTAYCYLAHIYGVDKVHLLSCLKNFEVLNVEAGVIYLVPSIYFDHLTIPVDIFSNSYSLSEMDEISIRYYLESNVLLTCRFFIESNVNEIEAIVDHGGKEEILSSTFPTPSTFNLIARFSAPGPTNRYVTSIYERIANR